MHMVVEVHDRRGVAPSGHPEEVQCLTAAVASFSNAELETRCARETHRFRTEHRCDDQYGRELFRRAIAQHDESAWVSIFSLYSPFVLSWLAQYTKADSFFNLGGPPSLVNATFAKFSQALTPAKWANFDSLGALLKYLKYCARSVLLDEAHAHALREREDALDVLSNEETAVIDDPAVQVLSSISMEELWHILEEEVRDEDERVLLRCAFLEEMKPQEIYRQHHRLFPTIGDVYRVRRNIVERLRRNHQLLLFVHREGYSLEHHSDQKIVHAVQHTTPCSGDLREMHQELDEIQHARTLETVQREGVLAEDDTTLQKAPERVVHHELTDLALHQTQVELPSSSVQRGVMILQAQQGILVALATHTLQDARRDVTILLQQHISAATTPHWAENVQASAMPVTVAPPEEQQYSEQKRRPQQRREKPKRETHQKEVQGTRYYQQMTLCSKERCKKCRNKIGHGPYWYSTTFESGRTKTKYIGKFLPGQPHSDRAKPEKQVLRVSFYLQAARCSKRRCQKCQAGGPGHGPYWYSYQELNGRTKRTYIGKQLPPGTQVPQRAQHHTDDSHSAIKNILMHVE